MDFDAFASAFLNIAQTKKDMVDRVCSNEASFTTKQCKIFPCFMRAVLFIFELRHHHQRV